MAGKARWLWAIATAAVLVPSVFVAADHSGCPLFERLRYDYFVEFNHGGDLFSLVHVAGFTDFRQCYEIRDRVTREEIRFESRGGEYAVRVMGADFDHLHVLRAGQNATGWYERDVVELMQVVGVASDLTPTFIPGETPPSLRVLPPQLG